MQSDSHYYPVLKGDLSHGPTLFHNEVYTVLEMVYQEHHARLGHAIADAPSFSIVSLPLCIYGDYGRMYVICYHALDVRLFASSVLRIAAGSNSAVHEASDRSSLLASASHFGPNCSARASASASGRFIAMYCWSHSRGSILLLYCCIWIKRSS